jgi:hypothetical protein
MDNTRESCDVLLFMPRKVVKNVIIKIIFLIFKNYF